MPGALVLIGVIEPRHSEGEFGFRSQSCICGGPPGIQTRITLFARLALPLIAERAGCAAERPSAPRNPTWSASLRRIPVPCQCLRTTVLLSPRPDKLHP